MNLRVVATDALARIAARSPAAVYALRRGVVMAARLEGSCFVAFRRTGGRIRLEVWDLYQVASGRLTEHDLPEDLEQRAAALLDSL
jgi:hypothetical protein